MTEIFENVGNDTKEIAAAAWRIALAQSNPIAASNFLNNVTEYYRNILTEEEVDFLRFYFNLQMEMMKDE
jgi:hypothetical protein